MIKDALVQRYETNENEHEVIYKEDFVQLEFFFHGVESYYNGVMLGRMSNYICLYYFNTISFEFVYMISNTDIMCNLNAFVNLI